MMKLNCVRKVGNKNSANEVILVTGCAGFIGFHLANRLLSDNYWVVGLDNLNDYYDPALKEARLSYYTSIIVSLLFVLPSRIEMP